jgi:hypothetical protein
MIAMLLLLSAAGKTIKSIQEFFKWFQNMESKNYTQKIGLSSWELKHRLSINETARSNGELYYFE